MTGNDVGAAFLLVLRNGDIQNVVQAGDNSLNVAARRQIDDRKGSSC